MKRNLPLVLTVLFLITGLVLRPSLVRAAELTIEKIGTSVYTNASSWTYYGTNPVFQGITEPGYNVTLIIDEEEEESVVADEDDGTWTITPTSLVEVGDYDIEIYTFDDEEVDTETVSLTLTIATQADDDDAVVASASTKGAQPISPEKLPATGSHDLYVVLALGGIFIGAGVASTSWLKNQY